MRNETHAATTLRPKQERRSAAFRGPNPPSHSHLHGPGRRLPRPDDGVHEQHVAVSNVQRQLLKHHLLLQQLVAQSAAVGVGCGVLAPGQATRRRRLWRRKSASVAAGSDVRSPSRGPSFPPPRRAPCLCTRIFPILMPLQQARSAVSMDSPDRMMDTPQRRLANSTPTYGCPVGVMTVFSVKGR